MGVKPSDKPLTGPSGRESGIGKTDCEGGGLLKRESLNQNLPQDSGRHVYVSI